MACWCPRNSLTGFAPPNSGPMPALRGSPPVVAVVGAFVVTERISKTRMTRSTPPVAIISGRYLFQSWVKSSLLPGTWTSIAGLAGGSTERGAALGGTGAD